MKYDFGNAIDLSHELQNGMPIYPGDPVPEFKRVFTIQDKGANVSSLTLGSHTGTHMDAPLHFIENATSIDRIPISKFVGEALVIDFSFKPQGSGITVEDFANQEIRQDDIVLAYTGCSEKWGDPSVLTSYTYLTPEGAKYLVSKKKIRAFGIDFLSVEKYNTKPAFTHKELLGNNVYIIESISNELKRFVNQRILFIALPIKFKGGDGAPCRALGVPLNKECDFRG
jgi:arylformamidase